MPLEEITDSDIDPIILGIVSERTINSNNAAAQRPSDTDPIAQGPSHPNTHLPSKPLTLEALREIFPNLTPSQELQWQPLFSDNFLYKGTPAKQFAEHLHAMMELTRKMRTHIEKQIEHDKKSLESIVNRKIESHKAFLEYQAKRDRWEWTKNVLDCISLTITGFSTLSTIYAYSTMGPAAPSALVALETALSMVFSAASLIMRAKKPQEVKLNTTLTALSLVISIHLWYAHAHRFQDLFGKEYLDKLGNIDPKQIDRFAIDQFASTLIDAVGCLVGYKKATSTKELKAKQGDTIVNNQKFEKKSQSLGDKATQCTLADKSFAGFIRIASSALDHLANINKKTNRGV